MKKYLLIALMLFSTSLFASQNGDIYDTGTLVLDEISKSANGLEKFGNENNDYDWYLDTIQVLVQTSVAVSIPWIATAKLQPEVELYWKR